MGIFVNNDIFIFMSLMCIYIRVAFLNIRIMVSFVIIAEYTCTCMQGRQTGGGGWGGGSQPP